jgi:RNA polymerase sigma-70 factor (ECF subfamily)
MTTEVIWEEFGEKLLGFIKARVNNSENAEDILQNVFLKIHQKSSLFTEIENLPGWIYHVTRNAIIDFYRRKKMNSTELDLPELAAEEAAEEKSFVNCMMPFVKELSPKYREALEKTMLENVSQKQFAVENELSYSAAKSRVQRAKLQLKELFSACCDIKVDVYGNIISLHKEDCECGCQT